MFLRCGVCGWLMFWLLLLMCIWMVFVFVWSRRNLWLLGFLWYWG